jgi:hypothetical protein
VTLPRLNLAALGPIEGHMGRRTLLLIAALVVAALGTTGIFLYVNGVDDRAQAGLKLVKILVATQPIAAGTTAQAASDQGAIDTQEYLKKSVDGLPVMSDIAAIATKVAISGISPANRSSRLSSATSPIRARCRCPTARSQSACSSATRPAWPASSPRAPRS